MSSPGMAKHSSPSFDESMANRLLSDYLEKNRTIKTFFKENDKTPNYDGTFEVLGPISEPQKQFIVQIKKVAGLRPSEDGKHVGKYLYDLDTKFLYYVKEKVTESPAIYFVVDIETKNIFWLYLSDERLMGLDFEGKQTISYAFDQESMLSDIEAFTKELATIIKERNRRFVNISSAEIAEIQDAVDYINMLFSNDLQFIKEAMFPDLWRFGIAHSQVESSSVKISDSNGMKVKTIESPTTELFALYPQIKGKLDYGFREFGHEKNNYFEYIDLTGRTNSERFAEGMVGRIIKDYFNNWLPLDVCPDIVLEEIVASLIDELETSLDEILSAADKNSLESIRKVFFALLDYSCYLLEVNKLTNEEETLKKLLLNTIINGYVEGGSFDIINMIGVTSCREEFKRYITYYRESEKALVILPVLHRKYSLYLKALQQLEIRKVEQIVHPWNYSYYELMKRNDSAVQEEVDLICEKWMTELPRLYNSIHSSLFKKGKYFNNGRFEYIVEAGYPLLGGVAIKVKQYESETFTVQKGNFGSDEIKAWKDEDGLISITSDGGIFDFLIDKMPMYSSLRCLLYQGICKGLNIKCNGLGSLHKRLFSSTG